jgi:hypothetical protein
VFYFVASSEFLAVIWITCPSIHTPGGPELIGVRILMVRTAELRDHGAWGAEVQVCRERKFLYGRRWANRALAPEEPDEQKARYLREGGVLIA